MQRLLIKILLPVALFTLTQCKKDKNGAEPSSTDPVKTETGTPIGDAQTFTVNATGGSFAWHDSSIVVTIPAGAVSTATNIQVQQIKNTCTAGIGKSFSLTPHGAVFQKPVSITFSFEGQDEANLPAAMGIAYQDKDGIWRLVKGASVNTVNKTVTIQTTHFSSWSLFQWLKLLPYSAELNPGEMLRLNALCFVNHDPNDLLTPLAAPADEEVGLTEGHLVPASFIKKWSVGGAGSVQPDGASCTYTAPSSVNDVTTAAVVAELASKDHQFLLISNVTILNDGVTFRVNGGKWIHFPAIAIYADENQYVISNGRQDSSINLSWPSGTGAYRWTDELHAFSSETKLGFNVPGKGVFYASDYFDEQGLPQVSGGSLNVDVFGKVGEYVSGSFTAGTCGIIDQNGNFKGRASLSGYFRVKRMR